MQTVLSHRFFTPALISLFFILAILHIVLLFVTPPGFFLDEAATGAHVKALLYHGTNAHGDSWPLFSASLGGGYTTPVYLYPLVAWSSVFGASEISLRAFSQVATLLAVGLLALSMCFWVNKKTALIAATVGVALPWGWLQGSLAWDPALVPLFIAASFLCFTVLLFSQKQWARISSHISLPLLLVGLAYLYPPCRVTAPLLYLLFYGVLLYKKALPWRAVIASSLGAAIVTVPLLLFMLEPSSLERSQLLSVFSGSSPIAGLAHVISNTWRLFDPAFLFLTGDHNLRHATGIQGMLGFAAFLPLCAILYIGIQHWATQKQSTRLSLLTLIVVGGMFASLLGSALTNEGQPHSLRATAAWPFFALLITLGWLVLLRYASRKVLAAAFVIFITGTIAYASDLAIFYPNRAASSFDVNIRERIKNGEKPEYPDLANDYYNL